jgi:MFS family permease
LSLIGLSFCRDVIAAAVVIFFLDLGMSCLFVVSSVFIQQIVADEKRGRVMSILVLFNFGLIPISSLVFFGGLGQWFGAMRMFRVAGLIGLVVFIIFMICLKRFRIHAKPKFVAAGLLPANARLVKV